MDSSTDTVSVAVHDGQRVRALMEARAARAHAEVLTPLVQQCLATAGVAMADLTELVVGVGPGAFTGLRVGIVSARTMASVLQVPCRGVVSMDAVAYAHDAAGEVAVVMDARRGEVFWAQYRDDLRIMGPAVGAPEGVAAQIGDGAVMLGDAAERYPTIFPTIQSARPDAGQLAAFAQDVHHRSALVEPVPLYLRAPDAAEPRARTGI